MDKEEYHSNLFPSPMGMYERFDELRSNDPFKKKREDFYKNYNRANWKRTNRDKCNKVDPNFGQFKYKVDAAMRTFIQVLTERKLSVRIIPKYAKAGITKNYSDRISSAFQRYFIKPWEDRFTIEIFGVHDMVFFGKSIEHWPTPGCVFTEDIPVENVFPDTNAGPDPKHWNYVFIVKDYTVAELQCMLEDDKDTDMSFNKAYLKEIIENATTYTKEFDSTSETAKQLRGDYTTGSRDNLIPIVHAYIKDGYGEKKKVSRYSFPAEIKNYGNTSTTEKPKMKMLLQLTEYCECISNVVHCRSYQLFRNYWKFNSFAQQVYLATMLYDRSMSLVIRAAKRSMILYWKSSNKKTQQKLMNQTDDEVQTVDDDTTYITTTQATNVREMVEVVRQIMIDTENGQSLAQAPGSQNVKGYAITAQEAQIRSQSQGEDESLNIKVLMAGDVRLYKEIYRRAMENDSSELKDAYKAFEEEMSDYNIDPKFYKFENVYFSPSYLSGGSQSSRVGNAQGVLQALLQQPSTPGQFQAQKDLVAAFVGQENVDDYIQEQAEVDPVIIKIGSENEDLDNPYLNPKNVPVLPSDKHMQEIPIHVADYEQKLNIAQGILKAAMAQQNPVRRMILIGAAGDLIQAQDNKGGHITAHIQAVSNSKENLKALEPVLVKFKQLQQGQDQMTQQILQISQEMDQQMVQSSMDDVKVQHAKTMNQLTETHAKTLNDIAIGKEMDKKEAAKEKTMFNTENDVQKKGTDLAFQEEKAKIDLEKQQHELEIKQQKDSAAAAKQGV